MTEAMTKQSLSKRSVGPLFSHQSVSGKPLTDRICSNGW